MPNGVVIYKDKEPVLTAVQLLARGMPFVGHSSSWTKEVKATDLSPYIPRRTKKNI